MRPVDWDEYGFTYAFDSSDEARAWVNGLLDAHAFVELVCRVHDEVRVPGRGDELCALCEAEHRAEMRLTAESLEAWCFMPPGERFPD